jgi:hypothetical protein
MRVRRLPRNIEMVIVKYPMIHIEMVIVKYPMIHTLTRDTDYLMEIVCASSMLRSLSESGSSL